jgi:hypothetical protein
MDPDPAAGGGDLAGGDPKPGAFDPAAFKADLLTELRKDLNGITKGLKLEIQKLAPKVVDPPAVVVDPPAVVDPPGGPVKTPGENAIALELKNYRAASELRIKALETTNLETATRAEKTDRESRIRSELAKYPLVNDKARETAFRLFNSEVARSEDGSLVANGLPFEKFIETELPASHAYLLKPLDLGGGGARPGNGTGGAKKFDLDRDLQPVNFQKFTPAEQAAIRQQVAESL